MERRDVIEMELYRLRRRSQRKSRILLAAVLVLALGLLGWQIYKGR